jgi:hypothetical protein
VALKLPFDIKILNMFLDFIFGKNAKKKKLQIGDVVKVKKPFYGKFPSVSRHSLLTVEKIQSENAIVIFMNDTGNNIFRETIPVVALAKVG